MEAWPASTLAISNSMIFAEVVNSIKQSALLSPCSRWVLKNSKEKGSNKHTFFSLEICSAMVGSLKIPKTLLDIFCAAPKKRASHMLLEKASRKPSSGLQSFET